MDLEKRRNELIAERDKALQQKELAHNAALRIDGAIRLLDEQIQERENANSEKKDNVETIDKAKSKRQGS